MAIGERAALRSLRDRYESLSLRGREVVGLVVSGLLNKQVGSELGISEITVKSHRGRVMEKMQAGSLAELVKLSARLGLTSSGDPFDRASIRRAGAMATQIHAAFLHARHRAVIGGTACQLLSQASTFDQEGGAEVLLKHRLHHRAAADVANTRWPTPPRSEKIQRPIGAFGHSHLPGPSCPKRAMSRYILDLGEWCNRLKAAPQPIVQCCSELRPKRRSA